MMIKVRATDEYKKRNLIDIGLNRSPIAGEEWEVTEERFNVLNANNPYNAVFVEKVENDVQEVETATKKIKTEKAVKKK